MNTGPAKNTYERLRILWYEFLASYLAPCERPPCGGRSQIDFSLREGLNTLFGRLFGRENVCTYTRRAEIISPDSDGPARRPGGCVSLPPHTRGPPRIVRADRRCDSSRRRRRRRIGGGRRSTPPRRNATCTRRCNTRASCRIEAIQPRKSARCGPDSTRGFGGRHEPCTARHAARVGRPAQPSRGDHPMNDPSGDFEKRTVRGLR